jgi:pimeloyl-ACP methyl ester carboxylesterase
MKIKMKFIALFILTIFLGLLSLNALKTYAKTYTNTTLRDEFISYCLFAPDKTVKENPSDYGLKHEDVQINLKNKSKLVGWYFPADKKTDKHIIYLHGSKGNIGLYLGGIKELHKVGTNILIVDYEGFGKSTGKDTISNTINDSIAMYNYLIKEKHAEPKNISLFGYSYGGAVAAELAKKKETHALVLESTFSSLLKIAIEKNYPFVKFIISDDLLNTKENIKKIKIPILIAYAEKDKIVLTSNSKELFEAANKPKYLYEIKDAEHHNIFKFVTPEYVNLIKKIIL